ncbi:hypothetical protein BYT27DRAFT_7184963 [Phlegmacium glaucopus]|nr:hypothetical protein BYT27DRAFT_7184963 [Phlegmacium glaucopus]
MAPHVFKVLPLTSTFLELFNGLDPKFGSNIEATSLLSILFAVSFYRLGCSNNSLWPLRDDRNRFVVNHLMLLPFTNRLGLIVRAVQSSHGRSQVLCLQTEFGFELNSHLSCIQCNIAGCDNAETSRSSATFAHDPTQKDTAYMIQSDYDRYMSFCNNN